MRGTAAIAAVALLSLAGLRGQAADGTRMDLVRAKVDYDGTACATVDRNFHLPGARLWLFNILDPAGNGALIPQKKWGDFFFGLEFGRPSGTNGGWSLWNVLSLKGKFDGKSFSIMDRSEPLQAFALDASGNAIASILWPLPAEAGPPPPAASLRLTAMKFPSHANWLFFKAELKGGAEMEAITLNSYPGNSNTPPERERVVLTRETEFNLSKQGYELVPKSPGLMLTSLFVHEANACLVVCENEKVSRVNLPKNAQGISLSLHFAPGTNTFCFALGHLNDMASPKKETAMFLQETQDNIRSFLGSIDWNPRLENTEAAMVRLEALLKDWTALGLPDDHARRAEADKLMQQVRAANGDLAATVEAMEKIRTFREEMVKAALETFR